MVITDLSICCHWRIECDCVSERQISGLGCFLCMFSGYASNLTEEMWPPELYLFFFLSFFHWHLTHQVLIWINSFPSYSLINSCSSGQCDWLWPNQKMEYLMNIKMMNTMRGNKSIHPSILFCLSSSGWWWWNWVPWVESKRMKSHHSLQGLSDWQPVVLSNLWYLWSI